MSQCGWWIQRILIFPGESCKEGPCNGTLRIPVPRRSLLNSKWQNLLDVRRAKERVTSWNSIFSNPFDVDDEHRSDSDSSSTILIRYSSSLVRRIEEERAEGDCWQCYKKWNNVVFNENIFELHKSITHYITFWLHLYVGNNAINVEWYLLLMYNQ